MFPKEGEEEDWRLFFELNGGKQMRKLCSWLLSYMGSSWVLGLCYCRAPGPGCPLLLSLLHGKEAEAPSFSLPSQLDSVEGP